MSLSSSRMAALRYGKKSAFKMKPAWSFDFTGVLPHARANCQAVSKVSGDVVSAGTPSTSGMTAAGLKKCIPSTRSALDTETASSRTGSVEVLVASTVPAEQAASSSENSCFLASRSSTTDSSTNSQYSSSARSVTALTRPRIASASAAVSLPFSTWRPSDLPILARQLSADSWDRLRTVTSKPALAATSAIPAPMMPEPTIPTCFVSMINLRFEGSYVDAVWHTRFEHSYGDARTKSQARGSQVPGPRPGVPPNPPCHRHPPHATFL